MALYCVTKHVMVMEVPESEGEFFARVSDSVFWDDKIRVKVLIELYEQHDCHGTSNRHTIRI